MLNDQFKNNPLSLRETSGVIDKFLYSCIGYYSADTFYKVGYENALNMFGKRNTIDDSLTKKCKINFEVPFHRYITGTYALDRQLDSHYISVKDFISAIYEELVADGGVHDMETWVCEVCEYVKIEVKKDANFYIDVVATYIWYVSFVHSLEHYQFHKLMSNFCLLTRHQFQEAVSIKQLGGKVFSQYDLWKSKHIVLTFGENHLNKNICESYADLDYTFKSDLLKEQQAKFKLRVHADLAFYGVPSDAIALSIRY